jgi:phenylacetate-CoA ligase
VQWERIGTLLDHAYEHVPHYRKIMQQAAVDPASLLRERCLAKLPILDRSTITQQINQLRAKNIRADRFVPNSTGGSTGEPLRFFDDRAMAGSSDAAVWRSHRWYGVDVGDRCSYLWGSNFDLSRFQGFTGRLRSRLLNLQMLPAWELSEATASGYWKQVWDFKPRLLLGYAGAVYEWARLLGTGLEPVPGLCAVLVSAETLYDEWRTLIESCFKVPVYNRYGGRDIHFVAQECPSRKGLHINVENVFVEIIRDGQPISPGELGEIVVTRLDNFAMPFIRYRSGDLGVMGASSCDCGRSLPLLQKIEGRVQDAILTADGRILSGLFFAHMMKDCPDVKEFQVHQLVMDQLRILIVLREERPFLSRARIERIIRQYMGNSMKIIFEIRDSIPLTRNGKRRVTVSHLQSPEHQRPETWVFG